jgi:hypothetical protein
MRMNNSETFVPREKSLWATCVRPLSSSRLRIRKFPIFTHFKSKNDTDIRQGLLQCCCVENVLRLRDRFQQSHSIGIFQVCRLFPESLRQLISQRNCIWLRMRNILSSELIPMSAFLPVSFQIYRIVVESIDGRR